MWVDGTQAGSTYSANVLDMGADMQLRIMGDHGAAGNGSGNLSNVRVVKDVAVYTGAFTPPTSPLTLTQSSGTNISAITAGQTQLLLPLTTVPFTDSSTNALAVTNAGTTVVSLQYPFTSYDTTGAYALTITNAGSIAYSTTNGGIFSKTTNAGTDFIYGGPNWVTGQSYSVFMAYQRTATNAGRLLNTQSEVSKDWLMGLYNGNPDTFYPNYAVNLPGSGADLAWHFGWATWNTTTSLGQLYTATSSQPTGVAYAVTNGGIFSKTTNAGTDFIYGGPNWVTGQSYSVFMAYQRTATATGRLLNTQSEASKDWLMGLYNGNPDTFYPNYAVNLPGSGADLVWHFGWATWNTSTNLGQLYTATNTQPVSAAYSVTNAGGGGFNQLRMFSRSAGSEVQSGNIGFIKVYNGVLGLADVQSLYATYKARFGY
jgi:hypothetical protein